MNTAKSKSTIGSESCNTVGFLGEGIQSIWESKPVGFMGYFGRYSRMGKGQPLALVKSARNGFYMVAPVDKRKRVCGVVRAIKRKNMAAIQSDFFMVA